ncbi:MAG: glycoside hydrolase family 30 protein [Planctomycetes bacterium]|nr:glycoside hydrolase family 30 protein [Planctomycetota bacterium]
MRISRALLFSLAPVMIQSMATHAQSFSATLYRTAQASGERLAPAGMLRSAAPAPADAAVFLDDGATFQEILGFGGAITDAAAETLAKLPAPQQQELLEKYFDPVKGIGYTLVRTHINSCDFSSASYTYVRDNDRELESFNLAPDLKYRIPMIKRALAIAGNDLTVYASPWSPPAWMKTNANMLQGGELKSDCAAPWANYYAKFIRAYEAQGVPIFGVTVQNEPAAVQRWESCIYSAEQERDFVKNHLGPALARAGLGDKKIIVWDHNRDILFERAKVVLEDAGAAKYVWGVGFHWYVGDHFDNVRHVQERFPKTHLLFTEGCVESFQPGRIAEWQWGERYGTSIIHDLNNGAVGWTDWNILLDERGGPNHVGNFCFAPVHADTRPGEKCGELTYMNSFAYLGHFSKFIRPGAKRIIASSTSDDLLVTAFRNRDGRIAAVVMNASPKNIWVNLQWRGEAVRIESPARSICTAVVSAGG